uniref:uncharacterized protein n=1 Tax=Myxine glutinosa TaxID=7769 RepID=UPI00358F8D8F
MAGSPLPPQPDTDCGSTPSRSHNIARPNLSSIFTSAPALLPPWGTAPSIYRSQSASQSPRTHRFSGSSTSPGPRSARLPNSVTSAGTHPIHPSSHASLGEVGDASGSSKVASPARWSGRTGPGKASPQARGKGSACIQRSEPGKEDTLKTLHERLRQLEVLADSRAREAAGLRAKLNELRHGWLEEEGYRLETQHSLSAAQSEIHHLRSMLYAQRSHQYPERSGSCLQQVLTSPKNREGTSRRRSSHTGSSASQDEKKGEKFSKRDESQEGLKEKEKTTIKEEARGENEAQSITCSERKDIKTQDLQSEAKMKNYVEQDWRRVKGCAQGGKSLSTNVLTNSQTIFPTTVAVTGQGFADNVNSQAAGTCVESHRMFTESLVENKVGVGPLWSRQTTNMTSARLRNARRIRPVTRKAAAAMAALRYGTPYPFLGSGRGLGWPWEQGSAKSDVVEATHTRCRDLGTQTEDIPGQFWGVVAPWSSLKVAPTTQDKTCNANFIGISSANCNLNPSSSPTPSASTSSSLLTGPVCHCSLMGLSRQTEKNVLSQRSMEDLSLDHLYPTTATIVSASPTTSESLCNSESYDFETRGKLINHSGDCTTDSVSIISSDSFTTCKQDSLLTQSFDLTTLAEPMVEQCVDFQLLGETLPSEPESLRKSDDNHALKQNPEKLLKNVERCRSNQSTISDLLAKKDTKVTSTLIRMEDAHEISESVPDTNPPEHIQDTPGHMLVGARIKRVQSFHQVPQASTPADSQNVSSAEPQTSVVSSTLDLVSTLDTNVSLSQTHILSQVQAPSTCPVSDFEVLTPTLHPNHSPSKSGDPELTCLPGLDSSQSSEFLPTPNLSHTNFQIPDISPAEQRVSRPASSCSTSSETLDQGMMVPVGTCAGSSETRHTRSSFWVEWLALVLPALPSVAWLALRHHGSSPEPLYNFGTLLRGCCALGLHRLRDAGDREETELSAHQNESTEEGVCHRSEPGNRIANGGHTDKTIEGVCEKGRGNETKGEEHGGADTDEEDRKW